MLKKKILHIIQSLGNGGCENMLLRTLPLLTDEFEHHIITLRELGELAPRFAEKGIPVTTIHQNGLFDIPSYRRLLSETRRFDPDTIITYLFHADMIGRLFLRPALSFSPSISPARGKMSSPRDKGVGEKSKRKIHVIPFLRTTYNHPKYLIARLLEKATKHLVPCYLANSEAVKDFYVSEIGVPAEKITVIPNGIDVAYFDTIAPDPKLRKSFGIASDDFIIICVANLHPSKGHRYLLEAFEQISKSISPARGEMSNLQDKGVGEKSLKLLLVGDGEEKQNLLDQIKNYQSRENILFLGRRTDVPQLLKISDCFILPTLFEGMSNAIMEAMASGLPIITTDILENRILIQDNKTGILVPPKNSDALTGAIVNLLGNPQKRKAFRENAKEPIRDQFDLPIVTRKLKELLNSF